MPFPQALHRFLQALSNENRQRIMLLFTQQPVLTVGEVAERTGLGMSTVSEHLKQLKEAGLLVSTKLGKEVQYRTDISGIQATLNDLNGFLGKCC